MTSISIREPAPTHPSVMSFGRGGAGNRTRQPLPPTTLTTTTSSHPHDPSENMPRYSTGRGGVGNMHNSSEERRMFSFDEELAKHGKEAAAPVYHIGRGGQGNVAVEERRRGSVSSGASAGSGSGVRGSFDWVRGSGTKV